MAMSMPNTRKVIRKQEEVAAALRAGLKSRGVAVRPRHAKRDDLIEAAKCGRKPNLAQEARAAIEARRAADKAAIAMVERLQGGAL